MGRAKASMELISNRKSRRVTYEKRRKGLEKKAHELSTLCGVKVGLIIYDPKDANKPMEPNIWPENHQEILSLINSYKEENIEDRRRRTSDLSMFYKDRTKKAEEELSKLHKKNIEAKRPTWDDSYDTLTSEELKQFGGLLESKLQAMKARLDFMKGTQTYFSDSAGSSSMMNSNDQNPRLLQSQDQNPYIVQSLFRRSSMQVEIIQPQPLATAFTLPQYGADMAFHSKGFNSFNANTMANPKSMMFMNDGSGSNGSSAYSSDKSSLAVYNHHQVLPLVPEHLDGKQVETSLRYYIPAAVQPLPVFVQYPLQPRGSTQMHKAQMEEYHQQVGDFQYMNQK